MKNILVNVKYAFRSILKNKVITILLIIQLAICMMFFVEYINLHNEILDKTKSVLKQYDVQYIYKLYCSEDIIQELNEELDLKSIEQLKNIKENFEEFLFNNQEFRYLIAKDNIASMPVNENTQNMGFNIINRKALNINNQIIELNIVELQGYTINETYINQFGIPIKEGRAFSKQDFKIDQFIETMPIIVGNEWSKYYKIGDVISQYNIIKDDYINMKIVGILEENPKLFLHEYTTIDMINDINKIVIFPYLNSTTYEEKYKQYMSEVMGENNEKDIQIDKIIQLIDNLIIVNKNTSKEQIENIFNNKTSNLELKNINMQTIEDKFQSEKESTQNRMMQNQFIFIILFMVSFIGITISFIVSINMRLKEFGIHILNGATKMDIGVRIFLELLIIIILSTVVAVLYNNINLYIHYKNIPQIENVVYYAPEYTLPSLGLIIGIIILAVISSIIPMIKLRKTDINDIMKGDE